MRPLPLRTALFVSSVGALVLLYLLWWTTYAGVHLDQRYAAQPAGAAGQVGGTSIRVLSLTTTLLLADQAYGGEPDPAEPGAVWVVAVLEGVQAPDAPDFFCTVALVGPEGRRWEPAFKTGRRLPSCEKDAFSERPLRFETVFLVPQRFAGQLVGIALLDSSVPDRAPVLTPPT